jgi:hypothetical protein
MATVKILLVFRGRMGKKKNRASLSGCSGVLQQQSMHVVGAHSVTPAALLLDFYGVIGFPHAASLHRTGEPGPSGTGRYHANALCLVACAHPAWLSKEADWLTERMSWPCTAPLCTHATGCAHAGLSR